VGRDAVLEDAAADGVVDGLRERVHERGGRHRDHTHRADPERAALVASYWKTLFLYETRKEGGLGRRSRHTGSPPCLNRCETDRVKLTGDTTLGHYENDLPSI
jgi:hypothetical protein